MKLTYPPGATPLDPDWEQDLIPSLSTMGELNEFEQQNIVGALQWALANRRFRQQLLTIDGLRTLHRRMFDKVWRWAGTFRTRNLNLGIEWGYVSQQTKILCDDTNYWIENETFPLIELAVRFHHRLVAIHPFVNGNGRHARLAADLILSFHGQAMLPWGKANLSAHLDTRREYIDALRAADNEDIEPLLAFAQSGG